MSTAISVVEKDRHSNRKSLEVAVQTGNYAVKHFVSTFYEKWMDEEKWLLCSYP